MDHPFFSIIIPVYNTPKQYLQACISSLCQQTMGDFEIILVDDGSHAVCAEFCDKLALGEPRLRVIHQVNQGVSVARNLGIDEACAPWIMFVDADDWIEKDSCQRLREHLEQRNCDMLLFNLVKDYPNSQEKQNYGFEDHQLYNTADPVVRERLYRRAMHPPILNGHRVCPVYYSCDKVFRRQFLIENDLRYPVGLAKSEDKVFILGCFEKLNTLYYVEELLYHYRMNEGSACHKYTPNADEDRRKLAELIFEIAGRMDAELAALTGNEQYDQLSKDCYRFLFGIISDVLFLKFFHSDNPCGRKARNKAAKEFLRSEPFKSAILQCRYSELSTEAKLKKFLLLRGYAALFCDIRQLFLSFKGWFRRER